MFFTFTLIFVLISIVPIAVLGFMLIRNYYSQTQNRFKTNASNILGAVRTTFQYEFSEIIRYSLKLSMSDSISEYYYSDGSDDHAYHASNLKKELYNYSMIDGVNSVYCFFGGEQWIGFYENIQDPNMYPKSLGSLTFFKKHNRNYIYNGLHHERGENVVAYIRKVFDKKGRYLGVELFSISERKFSEIFEKNRTLDYDYLIIDTLGNVIYSSEPALRGVALHSQALLIHDDSLTIGNEKYSYESMAEAKSGLTFYCYASDSLINGELSAFTHSTIIICLLCFLICLFLSSLVSRFLTKPISSLIEKIRGSGNAHHDGTVALSGTNSYKDMISILENTIEDYNSSQEKRRMAELRALMFQINPHFLYNTLSSVVWLCNEGDPQGAAQTAELLSNYFRLSISQGNDIIPLKDELNHAKNYLEILKIRYPTKLKTRFHYNRSLDVLPVPKLIIQPIIENSFYHGIKETDRECLIRIDVELKNNALTIVVCDDAGMLTSEKAADLNDFLTGSAMKSAEYGIGVKNVCERIKLFAGESSGLRFHVEQGMVYAIIEIIYEECGNHV